MAYPQPRFIRMVPGTHSPLLAMFLSLLCFTGLGQMYNRQIIKGVVVLIGALVLVVLTAGFGILIAWPIAAADAYKVGSRLNRGEAVGEWEFF